MRERTFLDWPCQFVTADIPGAGREVVAGVRTNGLRGRDGRYHTCPA